MSLPFTAADVAQQVMDLINVHSTELYATKSSADPILIVDYTDEDGQIRRTYQIDVLSL